MPNLIRTVLKHEHTSCVDKERGSRFWAAVELLSSTWFVVESCVEGQTEIQRWVTTSIRDATQIEQSMEPSKWARIFICMDAPLSVRCGIIFEEVSEAYQLGSDDAYLYQLGNGMAYAVCDGVVQGMQSGPLNLKLLYAKKRK